MKARLATVLSISGVLVAGSAAALVNTQVLSATPSGSSNENVVLDVSSTLPGTSLPGTTVPGVTLPTGTTVAPSSSQAVYQIGDAGMVTLDTAGERLTIVSAVPQAGWTVTKAENDDSLHIEVKFQSASLEVEFHANLLFGVVSTSVETKSLVANSGGTTVSTPGSGNTSNTIDDDDDDSYDDSDDDSDDDIDDDNSGSGSDDDSDDDSHDEDESDDD